MKTPAIILLILMLISTVNNVQSQSHVTTEKAVPAFPGALGGGKYVTGGRGGVILQVTSLDDDARKPGTLRWAVQQKGPRIILFQVAGRIALDSMLIIKQPNVTIAGHSAPGDGITISGYPVSVSADNVIIQFVRFRMGDENNVQDDALKGLRRKNIMIDHCSMSWSTDECSSFYDNENFTMQWCILAESLRNSTHAKGAHGYGGIWGGSHASFHHNLLAHHDNRNPRFCGSRYNNAPEREKVDFRFNIIYNWGSNSGYAGEGGEYNIVGNYYKPGPASLARKGAHNYRIFSPNSDLGVNRQSKGVWGKFYVADNVMHGFPEVTEDNWSGIHIANRSDENMTHAGIRSTTEFVWFDYPTKSAHQAYEDVLAKSGASFVRDLVDMRVVEEVRQGKYTFQGSKGSRNGLIDSHLDVGSWPEYSAGEFKLDSDGDGIPDWWEDAHQLDKNSKNDAAIFSLSADYTNIELYLHSLVNHLY